MRDHIVTKPRPDLNVPGVEAVWAEILYGGRKVIIGSMYRPPNSRVEGWDKIEESIENAKQAGVDHIFLMGDLNCDYQIAGNKLEQLFDAMNMIQLITAPTHRTENSHTLLDIIATNSLDLVERTNVGPPFPEQPRNSAGAGRPKEETNERGRENSV